MTKLYEVFVYVENSNIGEKLGEVEAESPLNAITHFMKAKSRKIMEFVETHAGKGCEISVHGNTGTLFTYTANERS